MGKKKPLVGCLAKPSAPHSHPAPFPAFPPSLPGVRAGWSPTGLPPQDPAHLGFSLPGGPGASALAAGEAAAASVLPSPSSARANCYL